MPDGPLDYENLLLYEQFPAIQAQFLSDIEKFKQLVMHYAGDRYSQDIDIFIEKVRNPRVADFSVLYALYRDTRYEIHALCSLLEGKLNIEDDSSTSATSNKDSILFILDECLTGINLCFPGVHSRISIAYQVLGALDSHSLSSKIFHIKSSLLKDCIQVFLLRERQKDPEFFIDDNEVHMFNAFHNIACHQLGLPKIEDHLARADFEVEIKNHFLYRVNLDLSELKIYHKLANRFFEMFRAYLEKNNKLSLVRPYIRDKRF